MAKRVTPEDIIAINEAYLICKSYSATAKATGWSASTVAKYVDKNYVSKGIVGEIPSKKIIIQPIISSSIHIIFFNLIII